jgi:FixJ family two-component response regulator
MKKLRVIAIVDDDPSITRMLTRALSFAEFEVAVFHSAEEFLESEIKDDTDFLILDVDLPGMSGIELQVRLLQTGQDVPIVFISGHATEETRQQALDAGAVEFLAKPFRVEALLAALNSRQQGEFPRHLS